MCVTVTATSRAIRSVAANRLTLLRRLTVREVGARYKGSVLGVLWSLLTPLLLLSVYAFVFGHVFKSRWSGQDGASSQSMTQFAIVLFAGLTTFQLFSDAVTRAPAVILGNKNFVKKVVFPLEILPVVLISTALFQYCVSMSVVLGAVLITQGGFSFYALLFPLVIAPMVILMQGLCWALAALGLFLRDINQFLGTLVSAMLFMSPVFYSRDGLPQPIRDLYLLNPLTIPVEQVRNVLIWGKAPDFTLLAAYTAVAIVVAVLGWSIFWKLRPGFTDVL
ncbi:MAG: ABC transporter permease [Hyphomonas sp.]|nr:ABC transporter permease [Hyphomonas sp.]